MPSENKNKVKFSNYKARWFAPVVIYFDLESIIQPVAQCCQESQNTETTELHKPCGFCLVGVEHERKEPMFIQLERSEDCIEKLVKALETIAREFYQRKQSHRYFTGEAPIDPDEIIECWICEKPFGEEAKVLDHCHYSGKFLGIAHNECNLKRRTLNFIPVVAHNLSNYDLHHLFKELHRFAKDCRINVIPQTSERYISLSVGVPVRTYKDKNGLEKTVYEYLRFIDSFRFMNTSLEKLVSFLPPDKFSYLDNHFRDYSEEKKQLLHAKGFYPYSYFDDEARFQESALPPIDNWSNSLREGEVSITADDWNHANLVFKTFGCENLGDYHDLYLKTDTLLLACVVEEFRSVCYETYKLDSIQYFSSSHLSGDAFLRTCKADLCLITEREHLEMVENMIRGGVSSVYEKRYLKCNNKYLDNYDPTQDETYGLLVDANNLYGGIMEKLPLPLNSFVTVNTELQHILNTSNDSSIGYILEVDLEYPDNLHDSHRDFPLAPTKEIVSYHDLSSWQQDILKKNTSLHFRSTTKKLVQTLSDKTNYTVHYITLKLYVSLGLKVTKVHRVLQFHQATWLKPYIQLNTLKRQESKNKFEESFYKLMNNSCYGKTLESKRKRVNLTVVRSEEEVRKVTANHLFQDFKIFDENLAAMITRKRTILWNKPTIVGATILDLAKYHMYNFHYNVMKKNFDCRLIYSDTDSLLYEIKGKDFYKELQTSEQLRYHFDLSNYPDTHSLYNNSQKLVTLKFKDEFAGVPIQEFIGLKPKMYSILAGGKQKLSAKGVTQSAQRKLKHELYRQVLLTGQSFKTLNTRIGSVNHQLQTIRTNKVSLSCFDDKRYVKEDGITCLPLGHYAIRDKAILQDILDDDDWGEDSTPPSPTWSEFQSLGWLPINDQESNEQRSGTPNVFDNTHDQMLDWSPPDPGLHQRSYSEEELNDYLADLDQSDDEQSLASRNPFIDDEAEDVDLESFILSCDNDERRGSPDTQSSHSSDIQVIAQYTEDERNLLSDIERYVDFGSDEEPKKGRKRARISDSESDSE